MNDEISRRRVALFLLANSHRMFSFLSYFLDGEGDTCSRAGQRGDDDLADIRRHGIDIFKPLFQETLLFITRLALLDFSCGGGCLLDQQS